MTKRRKTDCKKRKKSVATSRRRAFAQVEMNWTRAAAKAAAAAAAKCNLILLST